MHNFVPLESGIIHKIYHYKYAIFLFSNDIIVF